MKTRWVLGAAVLCAAVGAPAAEPSVGTIRGERVNIRARPSLQAEVVGQLNEPASVAIRSVSNEWVEIAPPAEFDLYVHRDFVQDGRVEASKLIVRAGPGLNYSKVGEMRRGDTVQTRGEFGEWLRIAPPPGASLWVSRSVVKLTEPAKPPPPSPPAVAVAPAPSGPAVVAVTPRPAAPPPSPASTSAPAAVGPSLPPPAVAVPAPAPARLYTPDDLRLAPVDNQGAAVQREGRLRATLLTLGRPSRYQLLDDSEADTICYLRGNDAQLRSFLDRRLRIRGRQYWVQGSRHPLVVVDQIAVLPD